jgi:uncharacterized protein (TIGR04255 family)
MALGHLQNSPLVRACLEITFAGEPSVFSRMDEYFEGIRSEYPALWVPNAQPGVAPALQQWEFKNQSGKRTVGISVNSFSFRVEDYVDYANFRESALPAAHQFLEMFGIRSANRLSARYTNSIPILKFPGKPLQLKNYLNIGFELPSVIDSSALEDIHLQFSSRKADSQVVINLHHELQKPTSVESLVFELDCALVENVLTDNLASNIDRVHEHIEDCFAALVADPYMSYMIGDRD